MIYLRRLHPTKDVGIKYQKWMNDTEVQKYTEQKHKRHSLKDIKNFIIKKNKSKNELLFGIFLKKKKSHIGNIKLGPINFTHKHAEISYFIGEKKLWGKGYTTKAIKEIISSIINICSIYNLSLEKALNENNIEFINRISYMERKLNEVAIGDLAVQELKSLWEESKYNYKDIQK